jgi:glycerophosphoryl diester phosphodiesterase
MSQASNDPHTHHWPYPRWIAHRGAGKLAPENTVAAFELGAQHGYRMFECDVKLSQDEIPFLLHDDTLDRTTNAQTLWTEGTNPVAGAHHWRELSTLDAGAWHSASYQSTQIPTLEQIAAFCINHRLDVNLEIKPTTGTDTKTGAVVARHAAMLWQQAPTPPLLSSFKVDALKSASNAEPQLPRALLLDSLWDGWLQTALELQCVAIVFHHSLITKEVANSVKDKKMCFLSYTVNDPATADRLIALGIDGIITDRVDYFRPNNAH